MSVYSENKENKTPKRVKREVRVESPLFEAHDFLTPEKNVKADTKVTPGNDSLLGSKIPAKNETPV